MDGWIAPQGYYLILAQKVKIVPVHYKDGIILLSRMFNKVTI